MSERYECRRGATLRLFGVVLLFLAALNSLLAWRGGYGPGNFPALLAGAGIFIYALGAALRLQGSGAAGPGGVR